MPLQVLLVLPLRLVENSRRKDGCLHRRSTVSHPLSVQESLELRFDTLSDFLLQGCVVVNDRVVLRANVKACITSYDKTSPYHHIMSAKSWTCWNYSAVQHSATHNNRSFTHPVCSLWWDHETKRSVDISFRTLFRHRCTWSHTPPHVVKFPSRPHCRWGSLWQCWDPYIPPSHPRYCRQCYCYYHYHY